MSAPKRRPVNASAVARPKWTGAQTETAIAVSRGEPRRSNAQMIDAIREQVRAYLEEFPPYTPLPTPIASTVIEAVANRLAVELAHPTATQAVMHREHLLLYVGAEIQRQLRKR